MPENRKSQHRLDPRKPLVVDTRDDYEQTLAGFRRYDVLFVNPVRDGLNLVAKEGPLVNERAMLRVEAQVAAAR